MIQKSKKWNVKKVFKATQQRKHVLQTSFNHLDTLLLFHLKETLFKNLKKPYESFHLTSSFANYVTSVRSVGCVTVRRPLDLLHV
jgi:hypothetical protein